MNVPTRAHELIMVMGVQRSGTNVLFDSLATDCTLSAFPEDIDSAFYCNFRLRPLSELAALIERAPGRILLKPISETGTRSLGEVAEEYRSYPLRFVWIYRDPVNVFDSMRRERWIATDEIDQPVHMRGWCKRNEYALQSQQQCPEQIAIVRYEDLCFDPALFRRLTRWLGLDCNSYFRKDSAQGRTHVAVVAQRNIDAGTGDTLAALDAARTFRPRRVLLLKRRIVTYLSENLRTKATASNAGRTDPGAPSQILKPAERTRPSSVPGLHFWLNFAAICHSNGLVTTDVVECGPYRMVAAAPDNGPYGLLSLVHRGTLYYPHSKTEERRRGARGTLCFGAGHDWNFFFDNDGFTVFALFRPNIPCYPPYNQKGSTLLRIGARSNAAPAFFLAWDGVANSSRARVISCPQQGGAPQTRAISTQPQSHRRQEWALITLQRTEGSNGQFSIWANGIPGDSINFADSFTSHPGEGYVLELGGFTGEPAELFYGRVAEIIIFKGALGGDDRSAITRYLTERHQL